MSPQGAMATMRQPITSPNSKGAAVNNKTARKQSNGEGSDNAENKTAPDDAQSTAATNAEMQIEEAKELLRQQEEEAFEATKKY